MYDQPAPFPHAEPFDIFSEAANPGAADEDVWALARQSYVETGCSSPVVAERHGLNARTVRRRAVEENWPGMRAAFQAGIRRLATDGRVDDAATLFVQDVQAVESADLLIDPDGDDLVRAAARLAGEAMHRRAPQESLIWLRVAREAERAAPRIAQARRGGPLEERFRMEFYRGLSRTLGEPEAETAVEPEAEAVAPAE